MTDQEKYDDAIMEQEANRQFVADGPGEWKFVPRGYRIAPIVKIADGPPPYALTDQHVKALERAIEAAGYRIMIEVETGKITLEKR